MSANNDDAVEYPRAPAGFSEGKVHLANDILTLSWGLDAVRTPPSRAPDADQLVDAPLSRTRAHAS
jgi:hypothetical protein